MPGKLSIVATPIGNRGDMTARALEVLETADVVLAEDTRVTGRLLAAFDIHTRLERCDDNVIGKRVPRLVERLHDGAHLAFCSDAGMPCVSDPGAVLVDAARAAGIDVEVVPGASALTTALAAAGFVGTAFYFGGFLPRKDTQRIELLRGLRTLEATLVFYESPHRVVASAAAIAQVFPERRVALCRELTKLHEEVLRLPAPKLAQNLALRKSIKGEIVLVVEMAKDQEKQAGLDDDALRAAIVAGLAVGIPKSTLAKKLAQESGRKRSDLYDFICKIDT